MSTPIPLATGLAGAIGCDYIHNRNQLIFVEYGGKISRINLIRSIHSVVSSGTATLRGTWSFDLEGGAEGDPLHPEQSDIWWRQHTNTIRSMVPKGNAKIANIGVVYFYGVSAAELQNLSYSSTPLNGNDDATNQLVNGDVFAVLTRNGCYAKVQVINYGYDLDIRWRTYKLQPAYQVLGTGYTHPEDVVVSADGSHAYVTERNGNLLRVELSNADRAHATTVSSGMTAPHQIAMDENRGNAYVVEYADPGRLLRIDLTTGAQTVLVSDLEHAIGLLMTDDLHFAYVSEQASGGNGQVSRIELNTGQREVLVTGMTAPFFLTWADAGEGAILTTERDPANRISLVDLTQTPVVVSYVATGVPVRPSSVAVVAANHLLLCSDDVVSELNLTESVYVAAGPIVLGIGHVPVDRIVNGYADTTTDPGYFFQVKDAPFGRTLSLMINHERAYEEGARYYKVFVDNVIQKQSWSDYRWSTSTNRFELQTLKPFGSGYFRVRPPAQIWYNHWLGCRLNTSSLSNAIHAISVKIYSAPNASSLMSTHSVQVRIDNQWPTALIDEIIHDNTVVGTCAIVDSGSDKFTFRVTAYDPEGHLKSLRLTALWGDNKSAVIESDSYTPPGPWSGILNTVIPSPPWHATVPGDPTSKRCAHTFYLVVWDRVINGYNYVHRSVYHKSITIML